MKILKRVLFVILSLIALLLIVAIFVPKDYAIKKELVINKPVAEVFNYVKYLKNQDNYSVWNQLDPNMKKSYTGNDGTIGFVYAWDGNKKAGKGAQEIISIDENKRVDVEIQFEKPMKGTNKASVITTPLGNSQTKVEWGFYGTSPYPFNLMNLCMNAMIGGDLQKNLENLKKILEK